MGHKNLLSALFTNFSRTPLMVEFFSTAKHVFRVSSTDAENGQSHTLQAPTEQEKKQWLNAIRSVIPCPENYKTYLWCYAGFHVTQHLKFWTVRSRWGRLVKNEYRGYYTRIVQQLEIVYVGAMSVQIITSAGSIVVWCHYNFGLRCVDRTES